MKRGLGDRPRAPILAGSSLTHARELQMIHQLRRPLLLSVLVLVLFASSAGAECAWVLWQERPKHSHQWDLSYNRSAFGTKKECDEAARIANDIEMQAFIEASKHRSLVPERTVLYTCLPDTFDPRGPKGK